MSAAKPWYSLSAEGAGSECLDDVSMETMARIAMNAPNPVFQLDTRDHIEFANGAATPVLKELARKVGHTAPAGWKIWIDKARANADGVETEMVIGEQTFTVVFTANAGYGPVSVHLYDISQHCAAVERAHSLSRRDELTDLPNRAAFLEYLEKTLSLAGRKDRVAAVHVIGMDGFKVINETKGPAAGDVMLRATAERLRRCLRDTDTVARLSGDEFAVIQPEAHSLDGAARLARRLQAALSEPMAIDNEAAYPTASMGIAMFPDDAGDGDEMIRNASIAMNRCKDQGGSDYFFFVSEMNVELQRRRHLEEDLRAAIANDDLELHYQPKLDLASGRITGMEALVRWIHPEHGFLSPVEFIPIAEASKLIIPLGNWVLREACRQTKTWNDAWTDPLKVAVNLSAVQLRDPNLMRDLEAALADSGLDPAYLELEITETAAMDDADGAIEIFNAISALGVALAIDDFGTGYSSLSYLKNLPVQRIKIDKAFVDDIDDSVNSGTIARAVSTMGQSFGMQVTAEGVEEAAQMAYLFGIHCQEVQGYFVSKPLPSNDFQTFMDGFDPAAYRPALDKAGFVWGEHRGKWPSGELKYLVN